MLYNGMKKEAHGRDGREFSGGQNDPPKPNTAETVATQTGVSRETVKRDAKFVDANQLGRRNLTREAHDLLLGRRYNRTKMSKAEAGSIGGASKGQTDTCLENAAAKLAVEHGVILAGGARIT
jgi:hypothetical protein